jgi:hypothetical protein
MSTTTCTADQIHHLTQEFGDAASRYARATNTPGLMNADQVRAGLRYLIDANLIRITDPRDQLRDERDAQHGRFFIDTEGTRSAPMMFVADGHPYRTAPEAAPEVPHMAAANRLRDALNEQMCERLDGQAYAHGDDLTILRDAILDLLSDGTLIAGPAASTGLCSKPSAATPDPTPCPDPTPGPIDAAYMVRQAEETLTAAAKAAHGTLDLDGRANALVAVAGGYRQLADTMAGHGIHATR